MDDKKQNPKHSVGDGAQSEQVNKDSEENYVENPKEKEKLKKKEEEVKKRKISHLKR